MIDDTCGPPVIPDAVFSMTIAVLIRRVNQMTFRHQAYGAILHRDS